MVQFLTHQLVSPAPLFQSDELGEAVTGLPTLPLFLGESFWRPGESLVIVPTPLILVEVPVVVTIPTPVVPVALPLSISS